MTESNPDINYKDLIFLVDFDINDDVALNYRIDHIAKEMGYVLSYNNREKLISKLRSQYAWSHQLLNES